MSDYNPFSLAGKTILVTGASSGIGQATAVECSKMGAKLVLTGRNVERLDQTLKMLEGDGHLRIPAELTDNEDLNRLVRDCSTLNGLALCAGKGMTLPFLFSTREKFDEMFNVNYFAPVELLRLLAKKKKIAKGASAVFIASVGGLFKFVGCNTIYGATKAAIISTMKFCAKELAPKGIRVNAVSPGMVDTPLIHRGELTEQQLEENARTYPLGRYGVPNDVAHGIVYLLSDASSWVTGQSLVIDGGVTI